MIHELVERSDYKKIIELVDFNKRVLEIGCSEGTLLDLLKNERKADVRGIEIVQNRVNEAVSKGLSVIQGDGEIEIPLYPDHCFDYVILSRTLPATKKPKLMLEQLVRIGKYAIISFPNFGYWKVRKHLLLQGTMPFTKALDNPWYETENIHLCTVRDFIALMKEMKISIIAAYKMTLNSVKPFSENSLTANFLAEEAIFMLQKSQH
jgi:methionine biosynthesis protein MetW